jgi:hypothetical protein
MGKAFLIAKLARVIMWILAGVIGAESAKAETVSNEVAGYIISACIALVTFGFSYLNDRMLLKTEPPKK